jgi:hypothetical protein
MKFHIFVLAFLAVAISLPTAADQTQDEDKGKELFEKHGCTNYH